MVLHDKDLVDELRNAFDKAKFRMWIAVPFIGNWKDVEQIIGSNWLTQNKIDMRLITDIKNEYFIDSETFDVFRKRTKIKSLEGLHAKVYVADDFMLITSANLTGAAFSKRYEIGYKLNADNKILKIFKEWWDVAETINPTWRPSKKEVTNEHEPEDSNTSRLKRRFKLPEISNKGSGFKEYALVVNDYFDFAELYEKHVGRIIPKLPLYQETDAFFNYLFHEHPNTPSNEYSRKASRKLNKKQFESELKDYSLQFREWMRRYPQSEDYRLSNIKTIKTLLTKEHLNKLTLNDVDQVVGCFHCMKSMPINKFRFLNKDNNNIKMIKQQWKNLLFNDTIGLDERMTTCHQNLKYFNKSSMREIVGWYYPEQYPLVTSNSNSGMKFFGYDIKTY